MKLVIGENEGAILGFLARNGAARNSLITAETKIPRGSVGTTLTRMNEKGWLKTEVHKEEHPTPIADTYTLYSLSPLGEKALDAWRVYFGK